MSLLSVAVFEHCHTTTKTVVFTWCCAVFKIVRSHNWQGTAPHWT